MAITTVISPASLSFANNPIIFQAKTDHSLSKEESFLRIVCNATFTLNGSVPYYTGNTTFSVELSQPVKDAGTATFNLSDAAQTLIRNVQSQIDMNGGDGLSSYSVSVETSFKDVWLLDNNEQSGDSENGKTIDVVSGGLTDYEMLTMSDITPPLLAGSSKAMTRKPDGGIVYAGEMLIVPTLLAKGSGDSIIANVRFNVGEEELYRGSNYMEEAKVDYQTASPTNKVTEGVFTFSSGLTGSLSGYYRTNTRGVHFLRFINGFGAVENIAVRAKDKLSYEVSGETHSLVQEISTRPTDRRYATKSQPVGVYELSSGYVPVRWAEWYVQELLTSPRVWIQIEGKWVPALIESEDDCVIYDHSKPEMPHVDFTLRLAIDGVTGCTW